VFRPRTSFFSKPFFVIIFRYSEEISGEKKHKGERTYRIVPYKSMMDIYKGIFQE
jgi:hypothetical protein